MSASGAVGDRAACAAALSRLPGMTPARLARVLRGRTPEAAWSLVEEGWAPDELRPPEGRDALVGRWREHASRHPPTAVVAACAELGVRPVLPADLPGGDRLVGVDPPVSVLFAAGDTSILAAPCVALVGTRRATALGREIASVLGADLARAGVAVVSGLAAGIDAAAHAGVLAAEATPPVGVVGSGLDVPYPKANTRLWAAVARTGLLLSEHPPGVGPMAHHFPERNRIVAALSAVVVVVESHRRGGALITADLAGALGRTVGVVPGSLRNPAAEGTNLLLRDAQTVPVLDALDVLIAAGVTSPAARPALQPSGGDATEQLILDHLGEGGTVDQLVARTGVGLGPVVEALDRLDERGLVRPSGPEWQRVLRNSRW